MPPRPSRNLDQALLAAGRELFPSRGCASLSVREVADAAGVNLGMFHYHFKSREAFLRALMQQAYEEMFSTLTLEVARHMDEPAENLRAALRVLGHFMRDNRPFLARVFTDALSGEPCARQFLRDNMPRHLRVLQAIVFEGQERGRFVDIPFPQVIGLCGGGMVMPILIGGALLESGAIAGPMAQVIEKCFLTDAGINQRIDLALKALATAPAATRPATKKTRKNTTKKGKP
jgi:AcrR family transcriptional regulator